MHLEVQAEPTEVNEHTTGITAIATVSGSHFLVFIILFIPDHVSIIIILFM